MLPSSMTLEQLGLPLQKAPEDTTVEVVPFRPGAGSFIDPDSIPRMDELDDPFRADPGHPANGGFSDLYDRLVLLPGQTRAAQMWGRGMAPR